REHTNVSVPNGWEDEGKPNVKPAADQPLTYPDDNLTTEDCRMVYPDEPATQAALELRHAHLQMKNLVHINLAVIVGGGKLIRSDCVNLNYDSLPDAMTVYAEKSSGAVELSIFDENYQRRAIHAILLRLNVADVSMPHYTHSVFILPVFQTVRFSKIYSKFPSLRKPSYLVSSMPHSVEHHKTAIGSPVHSFRRRIHPEKLRIPKAEFDHMLQLGIIRPSK
ncbi:hypothetical protein X801_00172, partial [Opisthorchis viverrini]